MMRVRDETGTDTEDRERLNLQMRGFSETMLHNPSLAFTLVLLKLSI